MTNKKAEEKLGHYADIIETTLDSFGIRARVSEIEDEKDHLVFNLEIVMGTPIEDIERRSRDLALALAAPDGKVQIIAPIPGRSLISIIMKKPKKVGTEKGEKYRFIETVVKEKEYVTFDNIERLRRALSFALVLLANGIIWIARKVDSEYDISWQTDEEKAKA